MLKYGDILVQDHQRFWSNCFCVQPLHPSALTRRNYWAIVPIAILELLSYVHPVVLIFLQFFCERKLLMVNRGFERPFWCFHDIFFWRKERKNEDLQATVEEIFWLSLSSLFLGRRWQISFLDVSDFLPAWTFLPLTAKALAWHFRCLPSVNCPQNFLFTLSAQNCRKLNFAVPSKKMGPCEKRWQCSNSVGKLGQNCEIISSVGMIRVDASCQVGERPKSNWYQHSLPNDSGTNRKLKQVPEEMFSSLVILMITNRRVAKILMPVRAVITIMMTRRMKIVVKTIF